FHNRLRDFIDTRETVAGSSDFTYLNVQDGRTRGAEAEAGARFGRVRTEGGYGWLDAVALNTGARLPRRPVHSRRRAVGTAGTRPLRGTVTGVFTGAVAGQPELGATARDAFLRWSLNLVQALPRGTELTLGADNLFAAHPDGWPGFTGRRLY